jgi:hypothetical protein
LAEMRPIGLRGRVALSYMAVSMAVVLLGGCLLWLPAPSAADDQARALRQVGLTAAAYAMLARVQAGSGGLSPQRPFTVGSPGVAPTGSLIPTPDGHAAVVPFISADETAVGVTPAVVLVADTGGTVVATSFPARYPAGSPLGSLLPGGRTALAAALSSHGMGGGIAETDQGQVLWSAQRVVSDTRTVGVAYVQTPPPSRSELAVPLRLLGLALLAGMLLGPVGAAFGLLTMRGSVRAGCWTGSRRWDEASTVAGCQSAATTSRRWHRSSGYRRTRSPATSEPSTARALSRSSGPT